MTTVVESAVDRFNAPLYTQGEASSYLGVPQSTLRSWSRGYHICRAGKSISGRSVITSLDKHGRRGAEIPFVGLAEGYALAAIRSAGVPLQRVRPALERLGDELGLAHALASKRLFTDGAEVLFDYSETAPSDAADAIGELVVVRNGQRVLNEVVQTYLQRVEFAADGYATAFPLPGFELAQVVADARRSFGQPLFAHGGARLEDALSMFRAGEALSVVAEEFGVPYMELEDAIRQSVRAA